MIRTDTGMSNKHNCTEETNMNQNKLILTKTKKNTK